MSDSLSRSREQLLSAYFHQDWGDDQESETDTCSPTTCNPHGGTKSCGQSSRSAVSARSPDKPARAFERDFRR